MRDTDQIPDIRSDEALEDLLKHASPRPVPSPSDKDAVKRAVRAEWQEVAGRHQTRRRIANYAIAATVLISVFALFSVFRTPAIDTVQVATIEKSYGSVYLLGEEAELRETADLASVMSDQTIVTGPAAGLALAWGGGGSVRIDESTRVNFVSDESIYLKSGRIYFDSMPASLLAGIDAAGTPRFVLQTDLGEVRHLGTQYMTQIVDTALVVSVREGQVAIDGTYHEHTAWPGEQVTLAGRQRPSILSIGRSGGDWDWVSRTTPVAKVEGRTLHEFLVWVSRELGLELTFEGGAEQVAHGAILIGPIDAEPADALRLRLATAALTWRIDDGVITISDSD
jgi:hypothetical protein